jgi:hypothetical protein
MVCWENVMACKQIRTNGTWEYVFKKAGLLEKPVHLTFVSEQGGDEYAQRFDVLCGIGTSFLQRISQTAAS